MAAWIEQGGSFHLSLKPCCLELLKRHTKLRMNSCIHSSRTCQQSSSNTKCSKELFGIAFFVYATHASDVSDDAALNNPF